MEGMDNGNSEITVLGIPYPFFEHELPYHVNTYNDQLKDRSYHRI